MKDDIGLYPCGCWYEREISVGRCEKHNKMLLALRVAYNSPRQQKIARAWRIWMASNNALVDWFVIKNSTLLRLKRR